MTASEPTQDHATPDLDRDFPGTPRVVRRHATLWLADGLLDEPLARRLLERSSHVEKSVSRNLMGMILSAVAGLFVLTGIILLIADHWEGIPRGVKLTVALMLLAGFQFLGWKWREHPDAFRRWAAQGLLLAGGGMILATIGLVSQIYNLNSRPPNGVLLWLVLLAPLPWLTRSTPLWLMTLGALTAWLGMEFNTADSLLYCRYGNGELWMWTMLGFLLWALVEARGWIFHPTGVALARFATATLFLTASLILSFELDHSFDCRLEHPPAAICFSVVALLIWSVARWIENRSLSKFHMLDLVLFALWIEILTGAFYQPPFGGPLMWATHLALCILMVREGAETGRVAWVNLGVVFILASVLSRYFSFFKDYLSGGLFFIVTGLFFFGLVWFLERERRRWAAKARVRT